MPTKSDGREHVIIEMLRRNPEFSQMVENMVMDVVAKMLDKRQRQKAQAEAISAQIGLPVEVEKDSTIPWEELL